MDIEGFYRYIEVESVYLHIDEFNRYLQVELIATYRYILQVLVYRQMATQRQVFKIDIDIFNRRVKIELIDRFRKKIYIYRQLQTGIDYTIQIQINTSTKAGNYEQIQMDTIVRSLQIQIDRQIIKYADIQNYIQLHVHTDIDVFIQITSYCHKGISPSKMNKN